MLPKVEHMRIAFRESGTTAVMIYEFAKCTLLVEGISAVVNDYRRDKCIRRGSASGSETNYAIPRNKRRDSIQLGD